MFINVIKNHSHNTQCRNACIDKSEIKASRTYSNSFFYDIGIGDDLNSIIINAAGPSADQYNLDAAKMDYLNEINLSLFEHGVQVRENNESYQIDDEIIDDDAVVEAVESVDVYTILQRNNKLSTPASFAERKSYLDDNSSALLNDSSIIESFWNYIHDTSDIIITSQEDGIGRVTMTKTEYGFIAITDDNSSLPSGTLITAGNGNLHLEEPGSIDVENALNRINSSSVKKKENINSSLVSELILKMNLETSQHCLLSCDSSGILSIKKIDGNVENPYEGTKVKTINIVATGKWLSYHGYNNITAKELKMSDGLRRYPRIIVTGFNPHKPHSKAIVVIDDVDSPHVNYINPIPKTADGSPVRAAASPAGFANTLNSIENRNDKIRIKPKDVTSLPNGNFRVTVQSDTHQSSDMSYRYYSKYGSTTSNFS